MIVGFYVVTPSHQFKKDLIDKIKNFKSDFKTNLTELDKIHLELKCCGISGPGGFFIKKEDDYDIYVIPLSCCDDFNKDLKCMFQY